MRELQRHEGKKTEAQVLEQEKAIAVATAVKALAKLNHKEVFDKIQSMQRPDDRSAPADLKIPHGQTFLKNTDPFFWYCAFVHLFPRGDCMERCDQRLTALTSERWAQTSLPPLTSNQ